MSNSRGEGNLLLIVKAAEGKRTRPNEPGYDSLNGCSGLDLLKGNKKRKLHKAQAPTTVGSLEVDAYAVDIKRVENPFVKDDEYSYDASGYLPRLKFHRSVSHAKMLRNAKEKKRRRNLKQAQLALHQELQPYTHQKPILRTILCTGNVDKRNQSSIPLNSKACG
ncbi:uncharacterized protein [Dysidea avara]|uniref:uncharacterized protein n=1 Tax=Dysidea avara TaxID=196820 RepID=UPI00331CED66